MAKKAKKGVTQAELVERYKDLLVQKKLLEQSDPFWFYVPSDGSVPSANLEFLRRHILPEDIPERLDSQMDVHMSTANVVGGFGGNQCLGGETLIYDPVLGVDRPVGEIDSDFHVLAWDGEFLVTAEAQKPFTKPVDDLYEFGLSNGESFVASMNHVVLTENGYLSLSELPLRCGISLLESSTLSSSTVTPQLVITGIVHKRRDIKYDFTVPKYHNYLASGVIHHNSGKSVSGALESFIAVTGEVPNSLRDVYPKEKLDVPRPFHVRVVGEDYVNGLLKNVIPKYREWCPREYLIDGSWEKSFSSEQSILRLGKKGELFGTIEFMSNKQSVGSFQGPPRGMVVYDEEPLYEIYKENLMRFTTAGRVRILFEMTPTKGMTWVNDEILGKQDIDGNSIECFKMSSVTNRYANLKVLEDIVAGLGSYEEVKMRLLGEFVSLSGRVYKHFSRSLHVIDPFPITDEYMVLTGMDPHQTTPTAVVFVAIDRENIPYVVDSYWGDKARDIEEVKADVSAITKRWRMGWSVVDQSSDVRIEAFGGLNIFDTLRRSPNRMRGLRKSIKYPGSIDAGVEEIKRRLKVDEKTGKPNFFIFDTPNNRMLINSMLTLERDVALNEEKKGQKDKILEGKHHFHAAMRYVFQFPIRYVAPDYGKRLPEYKPEVPAVAY